MNRESQFGCDSDFVEILGQAKALPNMARPNDEEVAGVTKPLRLSSFEGVKVERNARNKGWLPVILRSSTFRIPPLPDEAVPQGKLNQFFDSEGGEMAASAPRRQVAPVLSRLKRKLVCDRSGQRRGHNHLQVRFLPFRFRELIQSKRTSPILVEGNRVAIHRMGDWEWRLSCYLCRDEPMLKTSREVTRTHLCPAMGEVSLGSPVSFLRELSKKESKKVRG